MLAVKIGIIKAGLRKTETKNKRRLPSLEAGMRWKHVTRNKLEDFRWKYQVWRLITQIFAVRGVMTSFQQFKASVRGRISEQLGFTCTLCVEWICISCFFRLNISTRFYVRSSVATDTILNGLCVIWSRHLFLSYYT